MDRMLTKDGVAGKGRTGEYSVGRCASRRHVEYAANYFTCQRERRSDVDENEVGAFASALALALRLAFAHSQARGVVGILVDEDEVGWAGGRAGSAIPLGCAFDRTYARTCDCPGPQDHGEISPKDHRESTQIGRDSR